MSDSRPDFDVGIIGGGPAGAAMAAYLARAGVGTVVFERSLFPRAHVGESLMPSSTRVLAELGFVEVMERERFPRKYGAVWTTPGVKQYGVVEFDGLDRDCQVTTAGVERNHTFHVDRARFDLLLLLHAHRLGAAVYEGVNVTAVDLESDPYPLITYTIGRKVVTTSVRVVVDASGRQTLLGNQLRTKMIDPVFDQYATYAWFEGFARDALARSQAISDYHFIHFLPVGTDTWMWQIPINDTITSIGVVAQKNVSKLNASHQAFFWKLMDSRPELAEEVRRARQIRPFIEEGDCRYALTQVAGDRYVLIGDAARFVDPIFSNGVSLALNSARFAHRDVLTALESGDFSRSAFETYETTIRRGMKNWSDFMWLYYRLKVLFTHFLDHDDHRTDVLRLMQGDVYEKEQPPVIAQMHKAVLEIEQNHEHVLHDVLSNVPPSVFRPVF